MNRDTIKLGETLGLSITAQGANGADFVMDGTWEVACRIVSDDGEFVVDEAALPIAAGKASISIDTGEAPWAVGVYAYDVRITDPDGNDSWSEPVKLTIQPRITPASA